MSSEDKKNSVHKEIPTVPVAAKYTGDYSAVVKAGTKKPDNPEEVIARNTKRCLKCQQ